MPRKKEYFQYSDTLEENILKLVQEQFEAKREFLDELAQAPLIRFAFVDAGHCYNVIVKFMKRFAITMAYFYDHDNDDVWPSAPLYTAPEANDIVKMFFTRKNGAVSLFEWELRDFDVVIKDETTSGNMLKDYVNNVYYDRRTKQWLGWSATSNQYGAGFTKYHAPPSPLSYIDADDLLWIPDDKTKFGESGTYSMDDLFKFWLRSKQEFEGKVFSSFELEMIPQEEELSEYDKLRREQQAEYEEQYVDSYDEFPIVNITQKEYSGLVFRKAIETDTFYVVENKLGSFTSYLWNGNEMEKPVINKNGMVYRKDLKYKDQSIAEATKSEFYWPFDPNLITTYFGNVGWIVPASWRAWYKSIDFYKKYGVLIGNLDDGLINEGYRNSTHTLLRSPVVIMTPKMAFERKEFLMPENSPRYTSVDELHKVIRAEVQQYVRRFVSIEPKYIAYISDEGIKVRYLQHEQNSLYKDPDKKTFKTVGELANWWSFHSMRTSLVGMITFVAARVIIKSVLGLNQLEHIEGTTFDMSKPGAGPKTRFYGPLAGKQGIKQYDPYWIQNSGDLTY